MKWREDDGWEEKRSKVKTRGEECGILYCRKEYVFHNLQTKESKITKLLFLDHVSSEDAPVNLSFWFSAHWILLFYQIGNRIAFSKHKIGCYLKRRLRFILFSGLSETIRHHLLVCFFCSFYLWRGLNFSQFPCRNLVIEHFLGSGPNGKLKKGEFIEAAKIRLQKEPTNSEFQKVSAISFCAWVQILFFSAFMLHIEIHDNNCFL